VDAQDHGRRGQPARPKPGPKIPIRDLDGVRGSGTDWGEAVNNIAWESGDMLLQGSGAAGPMAQVFLGSAASKILRHAPVPVMIVPRHRMPTR
jgi:nucleotide-binding universal stress UspA family protein